MFEDIEFLQTDAAINKGNSGGPMFNHRGELIGIVSYIQSQSGGSEGLGFEVAINNAKILLLANPALWWGMRSIPIGAHALRALNVPDYSYALLIQNVVEGSLASAFNLRPGTIPILIEGQPVLLGGDVLVEMGGQAFYRTPENVARLQKYLTAVAVGEELELTVFRDGKRKRLVANKPDSN